MSGSITGLGVISEVGCPGREREPGVGNRPVHTGVTEVREGHSGRSTRPVTRDLRHSLFVRKTVRRDSQGVVRRRLMCFGLNLWSELFGVVVGSRLGKFLSVIR